MFRKTGKWDRNWRKRWFEHVPGPWQVETNSSCAITVDINGDGLDDLIVCNRGGSLRATARLYQQTRNGGFLPNPWGGTFNMVDWRNARVGDFNGDGILDLATVAGGHEGSFLRVFRGIRRRPWFDFRQSAIWYQRPLPFAAPDLEVLDFNRDGIMDLYIVQTDERRFDGRGRLRQRAYCANKFNPQAWWPKNQTSPMTPPNNFVPPPDIAPDLQLISRPRSNNFGGRFQEIRMNHRLPGCGCFVKKFNDRSIVLASGGFDRPGHQYLLQF